MFIELIDVLRCPAEHPPISLVAAITRRDQRFVIEGMLGCPTCRREYPIRDGAAWFTGQDHERRSGASPRAAPIAIERSVDAEHDGAMRIGALLSAADGMTVILEGAWAEFAAPLSDLLALRVFAMNPSGPVPESERVGVIHCAHTLPFGQRSLRGIALGSADWADADIDAAVGTLAEAGRLVAPASVRLPSGVEEIARDERVWVAAKRSLLVPLRRG